MTNDAPTAITSDDLRCLHRWRKIVTARGIFTNIGSAVIWTSSSIGALETPQAERDKHFHEVSSWLP